MAENLKEIKAIGRLISKIFHLTNRVFFLNVIHQSWYNEEVSLLKLNKNNFWNTLKNEKKGGEIIESIHELKHIY